MYFSVQRRSLFLLMCDPKKRKKKQKKNIFLGKSANRKPSLSKKPETLP